MTYQQKLEKVTEAIHKACPDLLEWRCENCTRKFGEYINGCPHCWRDELSREENIKIFPDRSVKLVFKELGIAEVLRAVHKQLDSFSDKVPTFEITCYGLIIGTTYDWEAEPIFFDLTKTLDQQEEPVIDLLHNILCA